MASRKWKPLLYNCGKCKTLVSEGAVNEHLKKCQPKGVECGKCKKLILDPDFVAHFKQCEGSPLAEIIAEKLQVPLTKQVREKIA
jgi:uncharacterized CHY-type Zn-finger protein